MFEFAAPVGALSQKRSLSLTCFVFAGQNVHSRKFKHLRYSENVNFARTNYFESFLVICSTLALVSVHSLFNGLKNRIRVQSLLRDTHYTFLYCPHKQSKKTETSKNRGITTLQTSHLWIICKGCSFNQLSLGCN